MSPRQALRPGEKKPAAEITIFNSRENRLSIEAAIPASTSPTTMKSL